MKKVGIMTLYYKTYNYGAQLQAYALQKAVSKLGYECEQISFQWSNAQTEQNYQSFSIDVNAFEEFSYSIPHSKRVYTPENIADSSKEYDAFICGSDQIWGVNESMPTFVLPLISLSFVPEDKIKIAYAASMGGAAISDVKRAAIEMAVGELDAVSVREKKAIPFVSEMTSKEVISVVDPVLLVTKQEWESIAVLPNTQKEYIFLYYIGQDKKVIEIANILAEKYNCNIITLAYINGSKAGPKEFIGYIKNAKFVITDSFHATVFSIVFQKQFLTYGVDSIQSEYSKNIRMLDLLDSLDLKGRFVSNYSINELDAIEAPIDYENVDCKLSIIRQDSYDFLKKELGKEKIKEHLLATKEKCSGCGACVSVCPQQCITFKEDELGFPYPQIDKVKCVDCGICNKTCPVLNKNDVCASDYIKAYAVRHLEEKIRQNSSSGGAFYAIASAFIDAGGLVVACHYGKDFIVEHGICEIVENLDEFCRSKYVQSRLGETFLKIKEALEERKKVLFVGTPCQVEGLKSFLRNDFDNLYTIDLICGGVTSPALWKKYIQYQKEFGHLEGLSMRNKSRGFLNVAGFPNFSMELNFENQRSKVIPRSEDYFLNTRFAFYRENCYSCDFKGIKHKSDITLGDFCGLNKIDSTLEDGKGTSLILVQSSKGKKLLDKCKDKVDMREYPVDIAVVRNPMVVKSMGRQGYSDYLRRIFSVSSIEKLYYESKYFEEFNNSERCKRDFWVERKRNELYIKLMHFQQYNLDLKDIPMIKKNIIIYGAGKLGRLLSQCTCTQNICFIDRSPNIHLCNGFSVYRLNDEELKEKIKDEQADTSIIVTPIWEFQTIKEQILDYFPDVNIISVEGVVENIYETM